MIVKNNNMEDKTKQKMYIPFVNGLKELGLEYNHVIKNWKYCGGNSKTGTEMRHLNYWKLLYPDEELPEYGDECVCGHKITNNCYITYNDEILILGNCCIKKFLPKDNAGRTCDECGKSHRNRKINKCNDCKIGYCLNCHKPCERYYTKCYKCMYL